MTKRVSIYLRNATYDPSSYYRICQYIREGRAIKINNYTPSWLYVLVRKYDHIHGIRNSLFALMFILGTVRRCFSFCHDLFIWKPDTIMIIREIFPRLIPPGLNPLYRRVLDSTMKVIWDIDDHILYDKEISVKEWTMLEHRSSLILTPSEYLVSQLHVSEGKITILPTTDLSFSKIDLPYWIEKRKATFPSEIDIVWTGSYGNLRFVKHIISYLEQAAEDLFTGKGLKLRLIVISNVPLRVENIQYLEIINFRWSRDLARAKILSSHIGIMPLAEDEYTLGKAGFKAIQYMGAGLPVLVSDVGYNKHLIDHNGYLIAEPLQWTTALKSLCLDQVLWERYSEQSRVVFESLFNPEVNRTYLERLLSEE